MPSIPNEVVGSVESDETSPHHGDSEGADRANQARSLRVMKDHDVARPDQRGQPLGVRCERRLVLTSLKLAQRAAVAVKAVQAIVQPRGQREET